MEKHETKITADFFGVGFRLSGTFDTRQRYLADVLYDMTTAYLIVEDAYVSPIGQPAKISASHPIAIIVKSSLSFALTNNRDDGLRRDQRYGSYLGLRMIPVFVTVDSFEMTGFLRLPGKLDPRVLLSTQTETFMTLMDVKIRSTFHPDVTFEGGAAIVNKTHIGFLGLQSMG